MTSLSRMRIAVVGKTRLPANTSEQRPVVTLWSLYAIFVEVSAMNRYEMKLEFDDGASCKLPYPYFMQDVWQNDPSQWPDPTFGDIYHYLINTPGMLIRGSMKAYKSG